MVVQDSRPLYDFPIVSPGICPRPFYDNWEPQFKPPEPTPEELAAIAEEAEKVRAEAEREAQAKAAAEQLPTQNSTKDPNNSSISGDLKQEGGEEEGAPDDEVSDEEDEEGSQEEDEEGSQEESDSIKK
jgi:hypothetical protein